MTDDQELAAIARAIVDGNDYMTLGTADADGLPWASPVWYAPAGYAEFLWLSSPEALHSRNLAVRPELSIVIFDSQVVVGSAHYSSLFFMGTLLFVITFVSNTFGQWVIHGMQRRMQGAAS